MPSKQFIDSVNERVVADTIGDYKRWLKQGEHNYRFQASYGNGGRTPNVGKVNTTGLFIWTFLIIQKKVLSVTVISENSLVTMLFFRRVAEKSCSYTMCKQRLK